jgi:hypothetical protein
MRVPSRWPLLIVLLLLSSACGAPTAPTEPPHLRGTVTSIGTQDQFPEFLIKNLEFPTNQQRSDPAECGIYVATDRQTRVWHRNADGALRRAALVDVQVGTVAEVRHTGIILDSCPAQARAESIVLLTSTP